MAADVLVEFLLDVSAVEIIILQLVSFVAVVPNLGPPDVLRLQLPEILASRGGGEGFWEL